VDFHSALSVVRYLVQLSSLSDFESYYSFRKLRPLSSFLLHTNPGTGSTRSMPTPRVQNETQDVVLQCWLCDPETLFRFVCFRPCLFKSNLFARKFGPGSLNLLEHHTACARHRYNAHIYGICAHYIDAEYKLYDRPVLSLLPIVLLVRAKTFILLFLFFGSSVFRAFTNLFFFTTFPRKTSMILLSVLSLSPAPPFLRRLVHYQSPNHCCHPCNAV
jgi:hypothetical protein